MVVLFLEHRDREVLHEFGRVNLPLHHLRDALSSVTEANLLDSVFPNVFVLVELGDLLFLHGVDVEVLVFDHDLLVEVIYLLLLLLSLLFDHVVAGDENSLEVIGVRECIPDHFDFGLEIRLAVILRNVLKSLHLFFSLCSLNMVWNSKLVDGELIWFFGVFIPVLPLHDIIKACLGLPSSFIILFFLECNFVFVDDWEG